MGVGSGGGAVPDKGVGFGPSLCSGVAALQRGRVLLRVEGRDGGGVANGLPQVVPSTCFTQTKLTLAVDSRLPGAMLPLVLQPASLLEVDCAFVL